MYKEWWKQRYSHEGPIMEEVSQARQGPCRDTEAVGWRHKEANGKEVNAGTVSKYLLPNSVTTKDGMW